MSIHEDDSFNAIVERKRIALGEAASKKAIALGAIANPPEEPTANYAPQGDISFLDKNAPNDVTYDDLFGKGTDADSAYVTVENGGTSGIRSASGIDTWEHSFYKQESTARDSQREHYSKLFGVAPDQVSDDMIFAMGRRADTEFRRVATEGQGNLDPETGTMSNRPGEQFKGFEEQMFFPEGQVTYDPTSKRYRDEKRVRVDSLINPATGTRVYQSMNTPEYNTKWFKDSPKQNAVRKAYEAKMGTDYLNQFKAPTEQELITPTKAIPGYIPGRGDDYWDIFTKSVSAGTDNIQATGYGLAALVADATGNTDFADKMLVEYQANIQEAIANGAHLPKVEDVDWTNPDQAYRQLVAAVGEFIPSMGLGLGSGKLAAMGTTALVKKTLQKKLKKEADAAASKAANVAATTAAVTSFSGIGIGGIYGDVASEGFRDSEAQGMAIVGGLLVGALDSALPLTIGKKLGITGSAKKKIVDTLIKNGVWKSTKNVAKDIAKGKVIEGSTETLQQVIENTTAELIKTGELPEYTSPEALSEYLNVLVKASLGGGAIKGGTTLVTEAVGAIDGNKKVVNKQTAAVLEEANKDLNTGVDAYDASTDEAVIKAVDDIEKAAKEEVSKVEQPKKTLKQKVFPTAEEKVANEEFLNETIKITEDLGIALPVGSEKAPTVDKAIAYLNSLTLAGDKELTNKSGRSTTTTGKLREALAKALNNLKSGDTATDSKIEIAISKSNINADYDEIIAKYPERVEEFETKRENALKAVDEVHAAFSIPQEAQRKDVTKATKVIDKNIQKALDKVDRINVKLEDTTIKPKQRKRLEQERNNQALHAEQLATVNKANTSPEMVDKIKTATESFDYQHKVTKTEDDKVITNNVTATKDAQTDLDTVNKKEDSTDLEKSDAELKYLELRKKVVASRDQAIKDMEATTDKDAIKRQEVIIRGLTQSIEATDAHFAAIRDKHQNNTDNASTNSNADILNSIDIESLSDDTILGSIDTAELNKNDKEIYASRVAVNANINKIKSLIEGNKDLTAVHKEVIDGTSKTNKGLATYLQEAKDGKFTPERFNAFVEHLVNKSAAFKKAQAQAIKTGQPVYINKKTLEVLDTAPTNKKGHWWVNESSTNLLDIMAYEAEFAENAGKLINQVIAANSTAEVSAKQQVEVNDVNTKIAKLIKEGAPKVEEGSLDNVVADETAPVKAEAEQTPSAKLGIAKYVNHSGGALGSDSVWGKIGENYGVSSNHYYYKSKTPTGNAPMTDAQYDEGLPKYEAAAKAMGRNASKKPYILGLMSRNWQQVKNADAVFAIVEGIKANGDVLGGTGYAVQMAKAEGKPVYVYSQKTKSWSTWDAEAGKFIKTGTPTLTPNFAGIGTRNINVDGRRAIKDVYNISNKQAETEAGQTESAEAEVEVVVKPSVNLNKPKIKATKTEAHLTKFIEKAKFRMTEYKAEMESLVEAGKKYVADSEVLTKAYKTVLDASKKLQARIDVAVDDLKAQRGVNKEVKAKKVANHILAKFKEGAIAIKDTTLMVSDLFKAKDINRVSFFSINEETSLTTELIATHLKKLGVTDAKYIKTVSEMFPKFKKTLVEKVLPEMSKKEITDGVYVSASAYKLLSTKEGLPDEVILATMLGSMHWASQNRGTSQFKPAYAIAAQLRGDPRMAYDLSRDELNTFTNSGIAIKSGSKDMGVEIIDILNLLGDKESELSLALHMELEKLSPAFKADKILIKDPMISKQVSTALGLLGLLTLNQTQRANKTDGGLLDIKHGKYDSKYFKNTDSDFYENTDGKVSLNTIIISDDARFDEVLDIFKEGTANLELIKGAETTLRDTYEHPVTEIQKKADRSFWDLPAKVTELLGLLQNVKWSGKTAELGMFSQLSDQVMDLLTGVEDSNTEHVTTRDAIDSANQERHNDVRYVRDYIASGSKSFYYKYKAMAQHRIRIVSNTINGQRSKIHRALFFPAGKTSTVKSEQDRAVFKLAVGQAFGVPVDKQFFDQSLEAFDKIHANPLMEELLTLVSSPETNKARINELILELVTSEVISPSMHVLEGVIALSKYDTKADFQTDIGIETDGITNGYAISLLQFMGGNPAEMKARLMKVGIFVDAADKAGYEKFLEDGNTDVYETMSAIISDNISNRLKEDLGVLHGVFKDDDNKLTKFARNIAKTPFMIVNYGASVKKAVQGMVDSIIPSIYKKLAKHQTNYDKAESDSQRAEIRAEVKKIEDALLSFGRVRTKLVNMLDETGVDKEGNPTNLYSFEFNAGQTKSLVTKFKDVYKQPIADALEELVGPIREARELLVQGVEAHYFAFMNAFNKETKGVTNLSMKMAIAGTLADKYMPRMSGPWSASDKTEELIQLIKFKTEPTSVHQVATKDNVFNEQFKEGKDWDASKKNTTTKSIQAVIETASFESPGVASAINMVQNMDSVVLGDLLLMNPEVLSIYDAVISSVTDALSNAGIYNKAIVDRAMSHSFLEDVKNQTIKLFNSMPKKELAEVEHLIRTKGFAGKLLIEKLDGPKFGRLNKAEQEQVRLDVAGLTIGNYIKTLKIKINEVEQQKKALLDKYPVEGWTSSQMYMAESIKEMSTTENVIEETQDDLGSIDIDATVKVELEEVYKTNSLKDNIQSIFDKLGLVHSGAYYNEADKATQQTHLQRVVSEIIDKAGTVLDNTTVTLSKANVKNHGYANISANSVDINFNRYSPRSHSEQSAQEVYTHEVLHILTRNALLHNTQFRKTITRIRSGVRKTLMQEAEANGTEAYEMFLHKNDSGKVIFLTDEATEIAAAKAQYDYLFGTKVPPTAVLDEFLAYALTNKFLVQRLEAMPASRVPLWNKSADISVAQKIIDMFAQIIDQMADRFSGKSRPASLEMEIFNLTKDIVAVNQSKRGALGKALRLDAIGKANYDANKVLSDFIKTTTDTTLKVGSDKYIKLVDKMTKDGKIDNFLANVLYDTKLVAMMKSSYSTFVESHPKVQEQLNRAYRGFKPNTLRNISSLKADLFGGVDQDFVKLLYKSHKEVDANRRQYKELSKEMLQKVFKDYDSLTDSDKEAVTRVILKADLSVLVSTGAYTADQVMELVGDEVKLQTEINRFAKRLDVKSNIHYFRQTRELARIMMKGKSNNHNQFLNAHNIYHTNPAKSTYKVEQGNEIEDLDAYISLLALQQTTKGSREILSKVATAEFALDSEHNGIHGILNLHTSFKTKSLKEGFNNKPQLMTKGYISVITDPDIDIQVEATDNATQLKMKKAGYKYIGKMHDISKVDDSDFGMYVIKNSPEDSRSKGITSATSKQSRGTTLSSIYARDDANGKNVNAKLRAFIRHEAKRANTLDKTNYTMIPIVNEELEIVDYRITMQHAAVEEHMNQDLMFDEVMPTMFSHLEDKVKSEKINAEAIELLYDYGQANYKDRPSAFVDIMSPRYYEEYFLPLPKQARWLIEQRATLSKDKKTLQFQVERKLLDTVFGYQNPSVANTRMFKGHAKAQRYARVTEKLIKEMVSMAVVNIVIKIPIVPAVNFASNFVTSMLYGVPPGYLFKKWRQGMTELTQYQTDAKKLKLLDIEVLSNPALKKDKATIAKRKGLVHQMNRNPVAGLVDAGLFTSITEDINQNEFTYRNKGFNKIKDVGNKLLKGKVFDVANHAYLGEHTAVFKASMQFTQMSDFIARYALYKYNTEEKGMGKDKAWKQMVETFVNYDQPMNRHLQYLNDIGLIMFVKYWLRIQRAGINLIKEKPLNVATFWAGSTLLDVDVETILDSNVVNGNFFPTLGGFEKIIEEVVIPPGLEILTGKGF